MQLNHKKTLAENQAIHGSIMEMKGQLHYFLGLNITPMPEDKSVDILHMMMIPVVWKQDLLKLSEDPYNASLSNFEERPVPLLNK